MDMRPWPIGVSLPCDTVNGACFVLGKEFLTRLQFLDEHTFLFMEEHTLGCQLRSIGKSACLVTSAIADHIQGASTKQRRGSWRPRMLAYQIRSELYYARRYLNVGPFGRSVLLGVRIVDIVIKGAAHLLRLDT
jgi:GT2 family glycosyltransferase